MSVNDKKMENSRKFNGNQEKNNDGKTIKRRMDRYQRMGEIPKSSIKFYPEIAKTSRLVKELLDKGIDHSMFDEFVKREDSVFDNRLNSLLSIKRAVLVAHSYEIIKKTWENEKGRKFIEHLITSFCFNNPDDKKPVLKEGELKLDAITKIIVYNKSELELLNKQMFEYLKEKGLMTKENFENGISLNLTRELEWDVKKYFRVLMLFPAAKHSKYSDVTLSIFSFFALCYFVDKDLDESTQNSLMLRAMKIRDPKKNQISKDYKAKRINTHGLSEENLKKLEELKNGKA